MGVRCQRARVALGAGLVASVGLGTFGKARAFGFIYDDYWTVVSNTHLDKPLRELVLGAVSGRAVEWDMPDATRPMMGWSLWLDRRLFGLAPGGYHVHSLLLYALCSVLVFLLALGVLRRFWPALVAGLLFAALPIHTEVVAAINYREDLIAAAGVLGVAVLAFWPLRIDPLWRLVGCCALWAYALLGKESALIAPAIVAALTVVRRPRLGGEARSPRRASPDAEGVPNADLPDGMDLRQEGLRSGAAPLPPSVVYGSIAVLWLNWRFGVSRLGEQVATANYASWTERVFRTARFEVLGLYHSLWPFGPRPEQDPLGPATPAWLLVLAAVVAAIVWLAGRRRTRVPAAAVALALVAPLGTSPLLAPRNEFADRYWFIGSLAACLLVAWGVGHAMRSTRMRHPALLAAALLIGGCSMAARKASNVWASEVDLWTFAAQTAPSSPRSWAGLARVHRLADQEALSERALARALELRPDHLPSLAARVFGALWFGKLDVARAELNAIGERDGLYSDSLRVARRCAAAPSAEAAQLCVRRTVPPGMVLGDPERLRVVSERLLRLPPARGIARAPEREAALDAGADGGVGRTGFVEPAAR